MEAVVSKQQALGDQGSSIVELVHYWVADWTAVQRSEAKSDTSWLQQSGWGRALTEVSAALQHKSEQHTVLLKHLPIQHSVHQCEHPLLHSPCMASRPAGWRRAQQPCMKRTHKQMPVGCVHQARTWRIEGPRVPAT